MPRPRMLFPNSWRARGFRRPDQQSARRCPTILPWADHDQRRTGFGSGSIAMKKPGIGSSPRRREAHRLLTGAGNFGDDFALPGQTFAVIVRSPHAHAILRRIETRRAGGLPGVLAVLTAADYLADGLKPLIHSPFTVSPPDITLRNRDG